MCRELPTLGKELTDFEKAHLNFGCEDDRIEFAICNSDGEYVDVVAFGITKDEFMEINGF